MEVDKKNIDDLLGFLKKHYDDITEENWSTICKQSLDVYDDYKPNTYQKAEELLLNHMKYIKSRPKDSEKPLFLYQPVSFNDILRSARGEEVKLRGEAKRLVKYLKG